MGYDAIFYLSVGAVLLVAIWLIWIGSRQTAFASIVLSTLAVAVASAFNWFFRDGLGPDAETSAGLSAIARFLEDGWVPIACWIFIVGVASIRLLKVRDRASAA